MLELMDLAHSYSDSFFSHVAGGLGFPSMKGGGFYAPFVRLHSACLPEQPTYIVGMKCSFTLHSSLPYSEGSELSLSLFG